APPPAAAQQDGAPPANSSPASNRRPAPEPTRPATSSPPRAAPRAGAAPNPRGDTRCPNTPSPSPTRPKPESPCRPPTLTPPSNEPPTANSRNCAATALGGGPTPGSRSGRSGRSPPSRKTAAPWNGTTTKACGATCSAPGNASGRWNRRRRPSGAMSAPTRSPTLPPPQGDTDDRHRHLPVRPTHRRTPLARPLHHLRHRPRPLPHPGGSRTGRQPPRHNPPPAGQPTTTQTTGAQPTTDPPPTPPTTPPPPLHHPPPPATTAPHPRHHLPLPDWMDAGRAEPTPDQPPADYWHCTLCGINTSEPRGLGRVTAQLHAAHAHHDWTPAMPTVGD